jgi:hypothetical protein
LPNPGQQSASANARKGKFIFASFYGSTFGNRRRPSLKFLTNLLHPTPIDAQIRMTHS